MQKYPSFMSSILACALIMLQTSSPAHAYDEHYGRGNSLNASFRLTIPFGVTKRTEDKIKYGLQLTMRREYYGKANWGNDRHLSAPKVYNAEILSLNFSENGLKGLSLAGREALSYKNGVFKTAYRPENYNLSNGLKTGLLIAGGVVLLVGAAGAIYLSTLSSKFN